MSGDCKNCKDYLPGTALGGHHLRLHHEYNCTVYLQGETGDLEVHVVLDDGAGDLYCTVGDDETAAMEELLDEVHRLRDGEERVAQASGLLREVLRWHCGAEFEQLRARIEPWLAGPGKEQEK